MVINPIGNCPQSAFAHPKIKWQDACEIEKYRDQHHQLIRTPYSVFWRNKWWFLGFAKDT